MTADATDWERHADGTYICVPISPADADAVRAWCRENCQSDYMIDLGRRVVFQARQDAALATMWWRHEEP